MTRRLLAAALLALAAVVPSRAADGPRRDLEADERRGGHTLARHVGKTDAQLRQRLRDQPNISAASTYPDRDTAELVVGRVLELQADRVRGWTRRRGARPNLAVRVARLRGPPVGRVLGRGERSPRQAHGAVVVLRWDAHAGSYFVLTSYPEHRE